MTGCGWWSIMREAGWVSHASSWSCHISSTLNCLTLNFLHSRINFWVFKTVLLRSLITHFKPNPSVKIHCSYFIWSGSILSYNWYYFSPEMQWICTVLFSQGILQQYYCYMKSTISTWCYFTSSHRHYEVYFRNVATYLFYTGLVTVLCPRDSFKNTFLMLKMHCFRFRRQWILWYMPIEP